MKPVRCMLGWHHWQEQPGVLVRDGYRQWWKVCTGKDGKGGCGTWVDAWRPVRHHEDAPLLTAANTARIRAGLAGIVAVEDPTGYKPEDLT